jgi:hypothetical protein
MSRPGSKGHVGTPAAAPAAEAAAEAAAAAAKPRSLPPWHFAAAAECIRQALRFVFAGCYGEASIDALCAILQAAAQHNAAVEASGLLTSKPKGLMLLVSVADLKEEGCMYPLQRTPLHMLVSNVLVSADAHYVPQGYCAGVYDLSAAAAAADAFGVPRAVAAARAAANTAAANGGVLRGEQLSGAMRGKLLQMYRSIVIHGWPAAAIDSTTTSSSGNAGDLARVGSSSSGTLGSGSSSSSSSVKIRGLVGRGEDGWVDCLDARNANSATPFQSAVHFCIPEAVRFFLQDSCFGLEMLTEPTLSGRELFRFAGLLCCSVLKCCAALR